MTPRTSYNFKIQSTLKYYHLRRIWAEALANNWSWFIYWEHQGHPAEIFIWQGAGGEGEGLRHIQLPALPKSPLTEYVSLGKYRCYFVYMYLFYWLSRWLSGKESACQCRRRRRLRLDAWVWKIPQRRKWQPTPVFLPGESHRQRSLAGYKSMSCKESNTTEWLRAHTHTFILYTNSKNQQHRRNL